MQNGFMNKIIGLVLALVIGATLVGGLLVPTVQAVTATESTFENEGYYRMSAYDNAESGDYAISWASEKPMVLVINDIEYDMDSILTATDTYFTIFASDGAYMRVAISTVGGSHHMIAQCHNSVGNPLLAFDTLNTTMVSMSLVITDDQISVTRVTDSSTSVSATYSEWMYVFDPDGHYVMKNKDKLAYVGNEDIIILAGVTRLSTDPAIDVGVYGHGTIEDLIIESSYPDDNTTYSNIVVNASPVAGYEELSTVGTITFNMARGDVTQEATYSYYLVPHQVTAEKSQHMDAAQIAIFGVVGLLGIVLLVTIAANAVRTKY